MWLQVSFALYLLRGLWHKVIPFLALFENRKDHSWAKEKEVNTSKMQTVLLASEQLPHPQITRTATTVVVVVNCLLWAATCPIRYSSASPHHPEREGGLRRVYNSPWVMQPPPILVCWT